VRILYLFCSLKVRDLIQIKVECHSGYKADEYPVRFYWDTIRFEIKEIVDRWHQGDQNPEFPVATYFKVYTTDDKIFILKHETKNDIWFLWIQGESLNL
jgi:hypothetical protein